ncbi:DDE superfamily endonuclease [Popillia japonica]|uniref:DDE superfamily endonuclease n=1 Tax=Popillia japonica TaxID=7064 RepID=A0AAW1KJC4_POPJA
MTQKLEEHIYVNSRGCSVESTADKCIFYQKNRTDELMLALFVDDGLLVSRNRAKLNEILDELGNTFETKLFEAQLFCGMEIIRNREMRTLYVHQTAYAERILRRFNMFDAKAISIPADSVIRLEKVEQKRKEKLEKQQIAEENRIKRETKRKLKFEQDVTLKRTKVKSTSNKEQKKSVRPETQALDTKARKYLNFGEELWEEVLLLLYNAPGHPEELDDVNSEVKVVYLPPGTTALLLYNAPGHPEELDDVNSEVKVVYLPPGTTALLQPMDQAVIATFKAYYLRRTFSQVIKAIDSGEGITLREFWKNYNILDAIKNIGTAWNEVKQTKMNAVWKKLCPGMVQRSTDRGKQTMADTVVELTQELQQTTETCVQLARKLDMEADNADFKELILSRDEEFTNDDLIQLEAFRQSEENTTMPPTLDAKKFTTKGLAEVFNLIDTSLAKLESMDSDTERFENVCRHIQAIYWLPISKKIVENIWVNDNNHDEVEDVFGDDSHNDEDYGQGQVSDRESEQRENDGENKEHEPLRNISSLTGKNGYRWTTEVPLRQGRTRRENLVLHLPRPKGVAEEAWHLLLTEEILDIITLQTNEEIFRKRIIMLPQTYTRETNIMRYLSNLDEVVIVSYSQFLHSHQHVHTYTFTSIEKNK